ncbi:hypothetical protein BHE74_00008394 [Ensete ventricosum]|nr:hypothetical protein GW17_00009413 [Ensete ventricosum]RWW83111.1 hypothetical protein BHE74_00008394 [Ensete ventricosum]RZR77787.1 hypothetical protein BHM03_00002977 [Ensete ventricosum]
MVRTGPPANRYANRPLSGGTADWGCFHPITTRNRLVTVDFDRRQPLSGEEGGRKKKRGKKNLEPGTALRLRNPLPAGDFFSPRGEKKRLPTLGEGMM